jgi:hypothetical protein
MLTLDSLGSFDWKDHIKSDRLELRYQKGMANCIKRFPSPTMMR